MKYKLGDRVVFLYDGNEYTGTLGSVVTFEPNPNYPQVGFVGYRVTEITPPLTDAAHVMVDERNILYEVKEDVNMNNAIKKMFLKYARRWQDAGIFTAEELEEVEKDPEALRDLLSIMTFLQLNAILETLREKVKTYE